MSHAHVRPDLPLPPPWWVFPPFSWEPLRPLLTPVSSDRALMTSSCELLDRIAEITRLTVAWSPSRISSSRATSTFCRCCSSSMLRLSTIVGILRVEKTFLFLTLKEYPLLVVNCQLFITVMGRVQSYYLP